MDAAVSMQIGSLTYVLVVELLLHGTKDKEEEKAEKDDGDESGYSSSHPALL